MTNYYPPQPYPVQQSNGMGITALVLGIVGLVFSFVPIIGVIAWPLVILGVIFGAVGINKAGRAPGMPKGTAIAGLTCSLVGLAICIIWAAAAASV